LIFSAFREKKKLLGVPLCYIAVGLCFYVDIRLASNRNNQMCIDLRKDSKCTDNNGWECKGSEQFGNMFTSSRICNGVNK
jgi:hypothetical protein